MPLRRCSGTESYSVRRILEMEEWIGSADETEKVVIASDLYS